MKRPSPSRIWVNVATATVLLMVIGQLIAGRYGLLFGFFAALLLNFQIFLYPSIRLFQLFPNQQLEGQDPDGILKHVAEFSHKAGIPTPAVYLIEIETPICYSAGLTQKTSAIFISEGFVARLSPADLRAALAFEVTRIFRFDTLAATISASLAGALSVKPLQRITAPLVAILIRIAFRRGSFYSADTETARLLSESGSSPASSEGSLPSASNSSTLGSTQASQDETHSGRQTLAQLLWKLDSYTKTLPVTVALPFAHLFIVTPLTGRVRDSYLSLQPKVSARIAKLTGEYPI